MRVRAQQEGTRCSTLKTQYNLGIGRMERGYEKGGLWNIAFYSLSHRQVGGLLRAIFHAEYAPLPRIVYFVGKCRRLRSASGHLHTLSIPIQKSFPTSTLFDRPGSDRVRKERQGPGSIRQIHRNSSAACLACRFGFERGGQTIGVFKKQMSRSWKSLMCK